MAASAIRSACNVYLRLMESHPLPMHVVQTGLLMGAGDIIAQRFVDKKSITENDWRRTANYVLVGVAVVGPGISKWYSVLERYFGKNGLKTALKKLAVDQGLFAPTFIPIIIASIALTEGNSIQQIKTKVTTEYKDVLFANYKLWPFVQIINFTLVPLNYRVIFVQIVALGWNTYLSSKLSSTVVVEQLAAPSVKEQ